MKPISIKLPDEMVRQIERYADELGVNFSVALRLILKRSIDEINNTKDFLRGLEK